MNANFNIVVLLSGLGSNLQAIIDAVSRGELAVNISAVISDQADAYGLQRASASEIPTDIIDASQFRSRNDYDVQLQACIEKYNPDLIVLAGFMRILSDSFVQHFKGRLINIHPSLLPKYRGTETHKRVLEAGDKETGSTVHFVTEVLDGGPIIAQEKIQVLANDTPETLEMRVKTLEHRLYPDVIQQFAEGKVSL